MNYTLSSVQFSMTFYETEGLLAAKQELATAARGRYLPPRDITGPELERGFLFQSEQGNGSILVTPTSIVQSLNFTSRERSSLEAAKEAALRDVTLIFRMAKLISAEEQIIYSGCTVVGRIETKDDLEAITSIYRHHGFLTSPEIIDAQFRTTKTLNNQFYTNTLIQNYRAFDRPVLIDQGLVRVDNDLATERGVEIQVDHNSRLAYNKGNDIRADVGPAKDLIRESFKICNEVARAVATRDPQ